MKLVPVIALAVIISTLPSCLFGDSHPIDTTLQSSDSRNCRAVGEEMPDCSAITEWSNENAESLPGNPNLIKSRGDYWFCPDVEGCDTLTLEQVADYACVFKESRDYPLNIVTLAYCKYPEEGECCYGIKTTNAFSLEEEAEY